jgi:hypothetical protein
VETTRDAIIIIKPTVIDLREEENWEELALISDQFLVSEQAVVVKILDLKRKIKFVSRL